MSFNPRTYFDSNPFTVEDFLKRTNYEIPENQRNYSWDKDNFERLWEDIELVIQENISTTPLQLKETNDLKPYFLGAVVLEKTNDLQPSKIIDGQQRLVTLTVLLSAIYEHSNMISDPGLRATLTGAVYPLFTSSGGSGLRDPRLKIGKDHKFYNDFIVQSLTKDDRDTIFNAVPELQKTVVKCKINDCYQIFNEKISNFSGPTSDPGYPKKIELLIRVVLKLLTVLELEVKNESVAYKVFETLNERGLDLTQADLIKNEVIRVADSCGSKSQAVSLWNDLESNLSENPEELNSFFRYFYISKYGVIKAQDTFDRIRDLITHANVITFITDAKTESELYSNLINTSPHYTNKTNETLKNIQSLKITYAYPVLLTASIKFTISADLEKAVMSIRDFCFRYLTVGGGTPDGLAKALAPISSKLRIINHYNLVDMMNELLLLAPDSVFVDKFKDFSSKNGATSFYILKSIEDHLAVGQGVTVLGQSSTQHLEHIMPKKPTQEDWGHVIQDERYNMYLNKIGNLLVLEKNINSHIKNKAFKYKNMNRKNKDYAHSVLRLPSQARMYLNNKLWDLDAINKRQEDLANRYAKAVWPIVYPIKNSLSS